MSKLDIDGLRNVLTHSNSVFPLRDALKRAIEIIEDQEGKIDSLDAQLDEIYEDFQMATDTL